MFPEVEASETPRPMRKTAVDWQEAEQGGAFKADKISPEAGERARGQAASYCAVDTARIAVQIGMAPSVQTWRKPTADALLA